MMRTCGAIDRSVCVVHVYVIQMMLLSISLCYLYDISNHMF